MGELTTRWNRIPFVYRSIIILGVGAVTGSAITGNTMRRELDAERSDRAASVAATAAHFSVGLICDKPDASVWTVQTGDTARFSCENGDGSPGEVIQLTQIDPLHVPRVPNYNQAIDLMPPAALDINHIDFNFDGRDGVATMSHVFYDGSVTDGEINNGIARNSSSVEGGARVTVNN